MNHSVLIDIIILLGAAVLLVPLFQFLRLGAVLGFLAAGLLVGPVGLALITDVGEIRGVAELGVVFLLFMIGIELKPSRLWLMRRMVFGLGSAQIVATGGVLIALLMVLGIETRPAVILGFGLALSSTAFVLQLLTDSRQLSMFHGRAAFAVLLMQDLAVVPLLLLVPLLAQPETTLGGDLGLALAEAIAVLLGILLVGRYLLRPLLHQVAHHGSREIFLATGLLLVLGTALAIEKAGMSMGMGAFIAGLLIANSEFRHQIMADIQPFRALLLGLFFMSIGMMVDMSVLALHPLRLVMMLVVLVTVKAGVLWGMARAFGIGQSDSRRIALLLAQGGEFAFMLFSAAMFSGLISEQLFQEAVLVVALSMALTPLLAHFAGKSLACKEEPAVDPAWQVQAMEDQPKVVIAGFGRMGQRVAALMKGAGIAYAAVERRPGLVAKGRADGFKVYFGDISEHEVLRHAGVADAKMVVVAVDDAPLAIQLVTDVRREHPHLLVFARGHSRNGCERLLEAGATNVSSENLEASLQLSRFALEASGMDVREVEELLERYRNDYYQYLKHVR